MQVGTKSILFGVHQFLLHPPLVALGWWKLYGFPWNPRLWLCFIIHDWGYWGCADMDGKEGEEHPWWAAFFMWDCGFGEEWHELCLGHSRFLAKERGKEPSRLCYADKLAIVYLPWWIAIPLASLAGELEEYRSLARDGKYSKMQPDRESAREWYRKVQAYLRKWVEKETTHETAT